MEEILQKIKPSKLEIKIFKLVTTEFIEKLNSKLKNAKAVLGGSGAKGTWLSGSHDIDIFVLFDYMKYSKKSSGLSDILEEVLKKTLPKIKIFRVHGSRDYFQLNYKKFFFEVIPILNIGKSEKAVNITDVSPLHSKWVNANTSKIKDEIRLAKQFCRANNLYGAESYISGFSGYVLEILVAKYGSFEKMLQASEKWKTGDVVDIEHFYKGKDALFEINSSKHSSLLVIDPVDKLRNAAAALSLEKFSLFKKLAKQYLKKKNLDFFIKKEFNLELLKKKYSKQNLVYIEISPLTGKKDVVGSKLLKAFNFLNKNLEKFEIVNSGWEWEQFYFVLKRNKLDGFEEKKGPPAKFKDAVKNFKKINKQTFMKNGQIYAKIKVKYPNLKDVLKSLFSDNYFKEKVKSVEKCTIL